MTFLIKMATMTKRMRTPVRKSQARRTPLKRKAPTSSILWTGLPTIAVATTLMHSTSTLPIRGLLRPLPQLVAVTQKTLKVQSLTTRASLQVMRLTPILSSAEVVDADKARVRVRDKDKDRASRLTAQAKVAVRLVDTQHREASRRDAIAVLNLKHTSLRPFNSRKNSGLMCLTAHLALSSSPTRWLLSPTHPPDSHCTTDMLPLPVPVATKNRDVERPRVAKEARVADARGSSSRVREASKVETAAEDREDREDVVTPSLPPMMSLFPSWLLSKSRKISSVPSSLRAQRMAARSLCLCGEAMVRQRSARTAKNVRKSGSLSALPASS